MSDINRQITVSQLTAYINALFEDDGVLSSIVLRGEISNFKAHSSGHIYFSLKDAGARISAVMFRSDAHRLSFEPQEGLSVIASGRVSVYSKTGQYQIYVRSMKPDGTGALFEAFEKLKNELAQMGYFDASAKKPLPRFPKCVALLTSPTGSVIRDMMAVAARRCPYTQLLLCPIPVQGAAAAVQIADMIAYVNWSIKPDLMILARGGGSIEDLWPFNERTVAEAIRLSGVPVVSGIGHETDTTIADFVADLRAPTPSAAAELALPDIGGIESVLTKYGGGITDAMRRRLADAQNAVSTVEKRTFFKRPLERFQTVEMSLDFASQKLKTSIARSLEKASSSVESKGQLLENSSYESVLSRGYAMILSNGSPIHADSLTQGSEVTLRTRTKEATAHIGIVRDKDGG